MSQRQIAHTVLTARGISRLAELREAGVTAATLSRMERDGEVLRLARGLYQLSDAPLDVHHSLAEAANGLPKASFASFQPLLFMV
jgi:transcriptional regulator with XRE-family HTH domain